jgi:hypothetical protein
MMIVSMLRLSSDMSEMALEGSAFMVKWISTGGGGGGVAGLFIRRGSL